jgi:hypothetical protein
MEKVFTQALSGIERSEERPSNFAGFSVFVGEEEVILPIKGNWRVIAAGTGFAGVLLRYLVAIVLLNCDQYEEASSH